MKIFGRISLLAALLVGLNSQLSTAQQMGLISGKVTDKASGETMIAAPVYIEGQNTGVETDFNGNYSMALSPGVYNLVFSYISFKTQVVKNIKVKPGDTTVINVELEMNTAQLDQVVVMGKSNKESEVALNLARKQSNLVVQKIGAQELSRKGVSNVEEGMTKVTGVSIVGNNELFVRGLGDRYNNATLNGLPIPSTDPSQKVIPLDIFPSGVIKNLSVVKSYSPGFYGDFSGGTVDIVTKGYPAEKFLKVGFSTSYNSISSVDDFFFSNKSTAANLGFARSQRSLPAEVAKTTSYQSPVNGAHNPFSTPFNPYSGNSLVNSGIKLSGGNFYRLKGGKTFGFLANFAFKNKYRYKEGVEALYNAQQSAKYFYNTNKYSYNTNTSGLVNLYFGLNPSNTFGFTSLFVNNSNDNILNQRGEDNDLGGIFARRSTYQQNTLMVNQLHGEHNVSNNGLLNWGLSYSKTTGSMPDRTQNTFQVSDNEQYFFSKNSIADNHKFFGELKDNEFSGKVEYKMKGRDNSNDKLLNSWSVGLDGRYKKRDYQSRQIDMRIAIDQNIDINNIDYVLNSNNLGDGFEEGTFRYVESYYPSNDYNADLTIAAVYANFDMALSSKLKLLAGLRAEYSLQNTGYKLSSDTYSRATRNNQLQHIDFLPALTLKYVKDDETNVLFSVSKTLGRPLFVEAAPFRYNDGFGISETAGNPLLENSDNYNVDLRYEIYPSNGELISFSLFGKYIDKPIERVTVASADVLYTFINTGTATVYGAEFEFNRNLGSFFNSTGKILKNTSLGLNAAYIHSNIKFDKDKAKALASISPTNTSRPMVGASPYLLNADISYKKDWSQNTNSVFTLTYNVFGKRMFVAGSQGAEDIYELPYSTLDLVVQNTINNRYSIDLTVGNILNPIKKMEQDFSSPLLINSSYTGIDVGIGFSYTFK